MAGAFTDISSSLKEVYPQETVEVMTNDDAPFRAFLKKRSPTAVKQVSEGLVTFLANTVGQPSVGQMADGIALPPTMDRTDVRLVLKPTNFVGSIELGLLSMNAADSNKSAFNGGELARSTNNALSHTAKFIESTFVGTHGTGRRARVESDGSNNFVASLPEGVRLLKEGYLLTGRSTDAGSVSGSFDAQRVTALADSTRTVTYAGTDRTLTAADHIHVTTVASQTLTSTFANGLRGLVDDGTNLTTVHGASRDTYAKLKSIVNSNGGTLRNLTEQILIRTAHEIQRKSGKKIDAIWGPEGQFEKYLEFVAPEKRVMANTSEPGQRAMGYKENTLRLYVPGVDALFYRSFDIVPRELYLLNMSTFFHYVSKELGPMDIGGSLHLSPGSGTFNASVLGYVNSQENLGCEYFEANGVIRDLKDPACGD